MVTSIRDVSRGDRVRWEDGEGILHQLHTEDFDMEIEGERVQGSASPDHPAAIIHTDHGFAAKHLDEIERAAA